MVKFIFLALLITTAVEVSAQNDGFEEGSMDCCRNINADPCRYNPVTPFNEGRINAWLASHGTPQINKVDCAVNDNIVHTGDKAAFLFYDSTNKEGIFRAMKVKKNESFSIRIFARNYGDQGTIVVKLAKGLTNELPVVGGGNPNLPVPNRSQLVISKKLTTNWEEVSAVEVVADNDYDQLWIYSLKGSIVVDDVSAKVSCCEPLKIYQSMVNPPSTFVNDYILAGRNVTSTLPAGDVEITDTNSSSPTIFQAGNEIIIEPGFVTFPGAHFIAQILPCSQTPIAINIANISDVNDPCHTKYKAQACFGSGFYTYTWSDDVRNGPNDSETKIITNGPEWFGKTISVTVVDNITNQVATKSVVMPSWLPFVEPIDSNDIAIANTVTPNGDSLNEDWVALDLNRPNTNVWAYNSFEVEYRVFDRRGINTCHGKKRDMVKGVRDKYVFCSGADLCENKAITYYYIVWLTNCKSQITIPGTVLVTNCGRVSPLLVTPDSVLKAEDELRYNTASSINLKPNPFVDYIELVNLKHSYDYLIFDIHGNKVFEGVVCESNNTISNLQSLSNGMYYLRIHGEVHKLIKL